MLLAAAQCYYINVLNNNELSADEYLHRKR